MDKFDTSELQRLLDESDQPRVSVFLPTHVAGRQGQQDPVRLKNLLQQAEEQVVAGGMRAADARTMLKPARDLPSDSTFWEARSHGLALFITPQFFRAYRLPVELEERVVVNRRFYIKPLLPLLTGSERYWLLALSQNKVQLFRANRFAIESVEQGGFPMNMDETLNYVGADRGAQVHSAMRGSLGKQAAVFHGQGGAEDARKSDLAQFFRRVANALDPILRDDRAPLLLAGVAYLLPIFREVTSYPQVLSTELVGNCDYLTEYQLLERSWPLVEPVFAQSRREDAARFDELAGTAKASTDLPEIVSAAHQGRIATLFVDLRGTQWGVYHPDSLTCTLHEAPEAGDDDLLDLAAFQTILHRGVVHAVDPAEGPSGTAAAAVYRY